MASSSSSDADQCKLDISGGRLPSPYSFPTSATVMDVKQRIESDLNVSAWRLTLYVLPPLVQQQAKMDDDDRTLASYGIKAGDTAKLLLEIEPNTIRVMLHYEGYPPWLGGDFILCYETATVGYVRGEILDKLHTMGLLEIEPDDMLLYFGNRLLDDPGAALCHCGVGNEGRITIRFIRNHPPEGTHL
ncbi:unnamed protein product [Linum trigynum]|uniref:Ubiquitin-like domain-containing protein n=1 Tax=Linum trigynum TaxID=586398 RepID=A0AAV2FM90_9ROSI